MIETIVKSHKNSGIEISCPGFFTHGECKHGHHFVKMIYCGRDWCPICGQEGSASHMRRISRWLPKAMQLKSLGYMVFTIPEHLRWKFRSTMALNRLQKLITSGDKRKKLSGILEDEGYTRGFSRWHWFGDTPGKYHPHLNVAVEGKYIRSRKLKRIKKAWCTLIGYTGNPDTVMHYEYKRTQGQMYHCIEYITRPTFTSYDLDPNLARELYNYRNNRVWGKVCHEGAKGKVRLWVDDNNSIIPQAWHLESGHSDVENCIKLEANTCPYCSDHLSWSEVMPIEILKIVENRLIEIAPGYYNYDITQHRL